MPPTIPYNGGGLSIPWTQFISKTARGATQSAWRTDQTRRVLTIDVNYTEHLQAIADALGFAVRDPGPYAPLGWSGTSPVGGAVAGPPYYLHRQAPMVHPETPWLVATEILSVDGIVFNNKDISSWIQGAKPIWKRARMTLGFSTVDYPIFADSVIAADGPLPQTQQAQTDFLTWIGGYRTPGDEFWRYCTHVPETTNETLVRERGGFTFVEGNGTGDNYPFGQPLTTGAILRQSKTRWRIKWIGVPDTGLIDSTGHAQLLDRAVGRVNGAPWYGFDANTLYFNAYKLTPHELPVDPLLVLSRYPNVARSYDVEWDILEFNPTALGGVVGGHNVVPWFGDNRYYGVIDPLSADKAGLSANGGTPTFSVAPIAISSLTSSGSTVTVVTSSAHNYVATVGSNQCWINVGGAAGQIGGVGPFVGLEYEGQFLATIVNSTTLTYTLPDTDVLGAAPSPAPGSLPFVMYGRRPYDTVDPRVPWCMLPPGA